MFIVEKESLMKMIMKRRLKIAVINKAVKSTIRQSLNRGKKLHPKITTKFIRMTETESLLGELF